jgi:hypothetical protein
VVFVVCEAVRAVVQKLVDGVVVVVAGRAKVRCLLDDAVQLVVVVIEIVDQRVRAIAVGDGVHQTVVKVNDVGLADEGGPGQVGVTADFFDLVPQVVIVLDAQVVGAIGEGAGAELVVVVELVRPRATLTVRHIVEPVGVVIMISQHLVVDVVLRYIPSKVLVIAL